MLLMMLTGKIMEDTKYRDQVSDERYVSYVNQHDLNVRADYEQSTTT